jgi:hypothetical protein
MCVTLAKSPNCFITSQSHLLCLLLLNRKRLLLQMMYLSMRWYQRTSEQSREIPNTKMTLRKKSWKNIFSQKLTQMMNHLMMLSCIHANLKLMLRKRIEIPTQIFVTDIFAKLSPLRCPPCRLPLDSSPKAVTVKTQSYLQWATKEAKGKRHVKNLKNSSMDVHIRRQT